MCIIFLPIIYYIRFHFRLCSKENHLTVESRGSIEYILNCEKMRYMTSQNRTSMWHAIQERS